jgi:hypothetical protein
MSAAHVNGRGGIGRKESLKKEKGKVLKERRRGRCCWKDYQEGRTIRKGYQEGRKEGRKEGRTIGKEGSKGDSHVQACQAEIQAAVPPREPVWRWQRRCWWRKGMVRHERRQ